MKAFILAIVLCLSVNAELDRLNFKLQIEANTNFVILEVKKEIQYLEYWNKRIPVIVTLRDCTVQKVLRGNYKEKQVTLIQAFKEAPPEQLKPFEKYSRIEKSLNSKNSKYIFFFNEDDIEEDGRI